MRPGRKSAAFAATILLVLLAWAAPAAAAGQSGKAPAKPATASPYIVGGSATTGAEFPWQVLITANGSQFCGGTLIHPMIVLTAAHCLVDENGNYYEDMPGVNFRAFVGRTELNSGGTELDWKIARADPQYNPEDSSYDWGFISLSSPASAPTLKLAGPDEQALWEPGRNASASGFGDLADGGPGATVLQQVSIPILADSGCSRYGSSFNGLTQLCAGDLAGGRDACQGDSGGPLSVTGDFGVRRLVGVVSTGNGCALPDFPGIYSKVAAQTVSGEIQQHVASIETLDSFPAAYTGIGVVGSGAKPLGCATAEAALRKATRAAKARARSLRAAWRTGKRSRIAAAHRNLNKAKNRLRLSRANTKEICS